MNNKQPYHTKRVSVTKIFTFDSAHRLDDYIGKCANLHGHTYKLEVQASGLTDFRGIVIDFGDLKKIVNEQIIEKYDHKFLNDLLPFHTTAENMVVHFFEIVDRHLAQTVSEQAIRLESMRLWETPNSFAEISRRDFHNEG